MRRIVNPVAGPVHERAVPALRALTAAAAIVSFAHVIVLVPRYVITDAAVPLRLKLFVGGILVTVAAALGGSVLALLLVARSWDRHGARSLALFLAAVATFWGSLLRLLDVHVDGRTLSLQVATTNTFETLLIEYALLIAAAAFLRFATTFPAPLSASDLPPPRRLRLLRRLRVQLLDARTVWLIALLAPLVLYTHDWIAGRIIALLTSGSTSLDAAFAANPRSRSWFFATVLVPNAVVLIVLPLGAMALGLRNLGAGFRRADSAERTRVLWLVAGASIAGWMALIPFIALPFVVLADVDWLPPLLGALWIFAPAVLVASATIAIFYSGAIDPRLVLRRSTIYGILVAAGVVLFTVLESVLSAWVEQGLGLPGMVGSIAAGLATAALTIPIRRNAAAVATRLGARLGIESAAPTPGPGETTSHTTA